MRILILALLALISTTSQADVPAVQWSGFAWKGDSTSGELRYPHSVKLSEQLDVALREKLRSIENKSFKLIINELGSIEPGASSSLALAFILDRETVSVEQFDKDYKILVELSAQAMFFDFKEMAIIASYPFSLQYIDTQNTPDSDKDKLVKELYLGDLPINAIDAFIAALSSVNLNALVSRKIQVTDVTVAPEVESLLPIAWQGNQKDFEATIAEEFGRALSKNQDVPILPFTKGYAIGNRMSARFANGQAFSLTIPEPDYTVTLNLTKLVKIEYAKVPAGTSYVYGAYLQIKAQEPLSGRTYIDTVIKNGATKVVPTGQTTVDDWPAYQASLSQLIDMFTKQLSGLDPNWVKKHSSDKAAFKQFQLFSKVVISCK